MAGVIIDMFKCLQCGNCEECLVVCPPKAIICNGPNIVPFIINATCTTMWSLYNSLSCQGNKHY